ncbi:hypothetical protein F5Y08DRAFT_327063 [Xylaria arbuscula]|nr:hypothetical protein F5Y08DRAFT_327063 [Xylaria arbuscula]
MAGIPIRIAEEDKPRGARPTPNNYYDVVGGADSNVYEEELSKWLSTTMDNKLNMLIEEPDEDGNIFLHIIRSWLQKEYYIIHIVPTSRNDDGRRNKAGIQCGAEQAKKEAVMLCRGHLRCESETLPRYPSSTF